MKKLVLIGAGGFGRETATIVEWINKKEPRYNFLGYADDSPRFSPGDMINGLPWLGPVDWVLEHKDEIVVNCTIGKAAVKRRIQESLTAQGVVFETLAAVDSYVSGYTKIGPGCVLYGGVSISVNCEIGPGVLLNQNVTIGHDAKIGGYTTIMPGTSISGECVVGENVSIGGHVFVIPGKKIGDCATVAAGSVVFSNVRAGATVLGNPAKRMRELEA